MKVCNIIKNDVAEIYGYKSLYTPLVYAPDYREKIFVTTNYRLHYFIIINLIM